MDYYGAFDFDLRIPADEVEEMEFEYFRTQREDDDPEFEPGDFCRHFNMMWGYDLASEEAPSPLGALAAGCVRGNIYISGEVHKKWCEWELDMMESLAPFIQQGGIIAIEGDSGGRTNWVFDGEDIQQDDEVYIRSSRLKSLEGMEKELENLKLRLKKAEVFLANHARVFRLTDVHEAAREIEEFLREKSPLERLAECSE